MAEAELTARANANKLERWVPDSEQHCLKLGARVALAHAVARKDFLHEIQNSDHFIEISNILYAISRVPPWLENDVPKVDEADVEAIMESLCSACWAGCKSKLEVDGSGPLAGLMQETERLQKQLIQCNLTAQKQINQLRFGGDDMVDFHEPMQFLDPTTRELVFKIAVYKLKQIEDGTAPQSFLNELKEFAGGSDLTSRAKKAKEAEEAERERQAEEHERLAEERRQAAATRRAEQQKEKSKWDQAQQQTQAKELITSECQTIPFVSDKELSLQKEIEEVRAQHQSALTSVANIQEHLEHAGNEVAGLRRRLEEAEALNLQLQSELSAAQAALAEAQSKAKESVVPKVEFTPLPKVERPPLPQREDRAVAKVAAEKKAKEEMVTNKVVQQVAAAVTSIAAKAAEEAALAGKGIDKQADVAGRVAAKAAKKAATKSGLTASEALQAALQAASAAASTAAKKAAKKKGITLQEQNEIAVKAAGGAAAQVMAEEGCSVKKQADAAADAAKTVACEIGLGAERQAELAEVAAVSAATNAAEALVQSADFEVESKPATPKKVPEPKKECKSSSSQTDPEPEKENEKEKKTAIREKDAEKANKANKAAEEASRLRTSLDEFKNKLGDFVQESEKKDLKDAVLVMLDAVGLGQLLGDRSVFERLFSDASCRVDRIGRLREELREEQERIAAGGVPNLEVWTRLEVLQALRENPVRDGLLHFREPHGLREPCFASPEQVRLHVSGIPWAGFGGHALQSEPRPSVDAAGKHVPVVPWNPVHRPAPAVSSSQQPQQPSLPTLRGRGASNSPSKAELMGRALLEVDYDEGLESSTSPQAPRRNLPYTSIEANFTSGVCGRGAGDHLSVTMSNGEQLKIPNKRMMTSQTMIAESLPSLPSLVRTSAPQGSTATTNMWRSSSGPLKDTASAGSWRQANSIFCATTGRSG
eukprot:TRINITY_DN48192_c0_g1_i1.p1 TRINITY_DN48192_c0_g1~~TRINITY_DN48192_c0_g1_i1.p1  ORF type:complete len:937 (-),score=271.48 TRINITY_DN48192_c0_g1_i1:1172-3982(-)